MRPNLQAPTPQRPAPTPGYPPPGIKTQPSDRHRPRQGSNLRPVFNGGAVPTAPTPAREGCYFYSRKYNSLQYRAFNEKAFLQRNAFSKCEFLVGDVEKEERISMWHPPL
eukprot:5117732-Pyramimonas_sp.AAC.1